MNADVLFFDEDHIDFDPESETANEQLMFGETKEDDYDKLSTAAPAKISHYSQRTRRQGRDPIKSTAPVPPSSDEDSVALSHDETIVMDERSFKHAPFESDAVANSRNRELVAQLEVLNREKLEWENSLFAVKSELKIARVAQQQQVDLEVRLAAALKENCELTEQILALQAVKKKAWKQAEADKKRQAKLQQQLSAALKDKDGLRKQIQTLESTGSANAKIAQQSAQRETDLQSQLTAALKTQHSLSQQLDEIKLAKQAESELAQQRLSTLTDENESLSQQVSALEEANRREQRLRKTVETELKQANDQRKQGAKTLHDFQQEVQETSEAETPGLEQKVLPVQIQLDISNLEKDSLFEQLDIGNSKKSL